MSLPKLSDLISIWAADYNLPIKFIPSSLNGDTVFIDRSFRYQGGGICWIASIYDNEKPYVMIGPPNTLTANARLHPADPEFFEKLLAHIQTKVAQLDEGHSSTTTPPKLPSDVPTT